MIVLIFLVMTAFLSSSLRRTRGARNTADSTSEQNTALPDPTKDVRFLGEFINTENIALTPTQIETLKNAGPDAHKIATDFATPQMEEDFKKMKDRLRQFFEELFFKHAPDATREKLIQDLESSMTILANLDLSSLKWEKDGTTEQDKKDVPTVKFLSDYPELIAGGDDSNNYNWKYCGAAPLDLLARKLVDQNLVHAELANPFIIREWEQTKRHKTRTGADRGLWQDFVTINTRTWREIVQPFAYKIYLPRGQSSGDFFFNVIMFDYVWFVLAAGFATSALSLLIRVGRAKVKRAFLQDGTFISMATTRASTNYVYKPPAEYEQNKPEVPAFQFDLIQDPQGNFSMKSHSANTSNSKEEYYYNSKTGEDEQQATSSSSSSSAKNARAGAATTTSTTHLHQPLQILNSKDTIASKGSKASVELSDLSNKVGDYSNSSEDHDVDPEDHVPLLKKRSRIIDEGEHRRSKFLSSDSSSSSSASAGRPPVLQHRSSSSGRRNDEDQKNYEKIKNEPSSSSSSSHNKNYMSQNYQPMMLYDDPIKDHFYNPKKRPEHQIMNFRKRKRAGGPGGKNEKINRRSNNLSDVELSDDESRNTQEYNYEYESDGERSTSSDGDTENKDDDHNHDNNGETGGTQSIPEKQKASVWEFLYKTVFGRNNAGRGYDLLQLVLFVFNIVVFHYASGAADNLGYEARPSFLKCLIENHEGTTAENNIAEQLRIQTDFGQFNTETSRSSGTNLGDPHQQLMLSLTGTVPDPAISVFRDNQNFPKKDREEGRYFRCGPQLAQLLNAIQSRQHTLRTENLVEGIILSILLAQYFLRIFAYKMYKGHVFYYVFSPLSVCEGLLVICGIIEVLYGNPDSDIITNFGWVGVLRVIIIAMDYMQFTELYNKVIDVLRDEGGVMTLSLVITALVWVIFGSCYWVVCEYLPWKIDEDRVVRISYGDDDMDVGWNKFGSMMSTLYYALVNLSGEHPVSLDHKSWYLSAMICLSTIVGVAAFQLFPAVIGSAFEGINMGLRNQLNSGLFGSQNKTMQKTEEQLSKIQDDQDSYYDEEDSQGADLDFLENGDVMWAGMTPEQKAENPSAFLNTSMYKWYTYISSFISALSFFLLTHCFNYKVVKTKALTNQHLNPGSALLQELDENGNSRFLLLLLIFDVVFTGLFACEFYMRYWRPGAFRAKKGRDWQQRRRAYFYAEMASVIAPALAFLLYVIYPRFISGRTDGYNDIERWTPVSAFDMQYVKMQKKNSNNEAENTSTMRKAVEDKLFAFVKHKNVVAFDEGPGSPLRVAAQFPPQFIFLVLISFRVFSVLRVDHYLRAFYEVKQVVIDQAAKTYVFSFLVTLAVLFPCGILYYWCESSNPDEEVRLGYRNLWISIFSTLIVSSGEVPYANYTVIGRILHLVLIFFGVCIFGIPFSIFVSGYQERLEEDEDKEELEMDKRRSEISEFRDGALYCFVYDSVHGHWRRWLYHTCWITMWLLSMLISILYTYEDFKLSIIEKRVEELYDPGAGRGPDAKLMENTEWYDYNGIFIRRVKEDYIEVKGLPMNCLSWPDFEGAEYEDMKTKWNDKLRAEFLQQFKKVFAVDYERRTGDANPGLPGGKRYNKNSGVWNHKYDGDVDDQILKSLRDEVCNGPGGGILNENFISYNGPPGTYGPKNKGGYERNKFDIDNCGMVVLPQRSAVTHLVALNTALFPMHKYGTSTRDSITSLYTTFYRQEQLSTNKKLNEKDSKQEQPVDDSDLSANLRQWNKMQFVFGPPIAYQEDDPLNASTEEYDEYNKTGEPRDRVPGWFWSGAKDQSKDNYAPVITQALFLPKGWIMLPFLQFEEGGGPENDIPPYIWSEKGRVESLSPDPQSKFVELVYRFQLASEAQSLSIFFWIMPPLCDVCYYFDVVYFFILTMDFVLRTRAHYMSYTISTNPELRTKRDPPPLPHSWQHGHYYIQIGGISHVVTIGAYLFFILAFHGIEPPIFAIKDELPHIWESVQPSSQVRLLIGVRILIGCFVVDELTKMLRAVKQVFSKYGKNFLKALYVLVFVWFLFATLLFLVERQYFGSQKHHSTGEYMGRFSSILTSLQFTLIHLTGDYPIYDYSQPMGLILHFLILFTGPAFVALPAGLLTVALTRQIKRNKKLVRSSSPWTAAKRIQRWWRKVWARSLLLYTMHVLHSSEKLKQKIREEQAKEEVDLATRVFILVASQSKTTVYTRIFQGIWCLALLYAAALSAPHFLINHNDPQWRSKLSSRNVIDDPSKDKYSVPDYYRKALAEEVDEVRNLGLYDGLKKGFLTYTGPMICFHTVFLANFVLQLIAAPSNYIYKFSRRSYLLRMGSMDLLHFILFVLDGIQRYSIKEEYYNFPLEKLYHGLRLKWEKQGPDLDPDDDAGDPDGNPDHDNNMDQIGKGDDPANDRKAGQDYVTKLFLQDLTIWSLAIYSIIHLYSSHVPSNKLMYELKKEARDYLRPTLILALVFALYGCTFFWVFETPASGPYHFKLRDAAEEETWQVENHISDSVRSVTEYYNQFPGATMDLGNTLYRVVIYLAGEWVDVDFTLGGRFVCVFFCLLGIIMFSIPLGGMLDAVRTLQEKMDRVKTKKKRDEAYINYVLEKRGQDKLPVLKPNMGVGDWFRKATGLTASQQEKKKKLTDFASVALAALEDKRNAPAHRGHRIDEEQPSEDFERMERGENNTKSVPEEYVSSYDQDNSSYDDDDDDDDAENRSLMRKRGAADSFRKK